MQTTKEQKQKRKKYGKNQEKNQEEGASTVLCSKYKYDYKIISYAVITKEP